MDLDIRDIDISDQTMIAFQQVLWKYVNALNLKFDLNYQYPIAKNEYGILDVY